MDASQAPKPPIKPVLEDFGLTGDDAIRIADRENKIKDFGFGCVNWISSGLAVLFLSLIWIEPISSHKLLFFLGCVLFLLIIVFPSSSWWTERQIKKIHGRDNYTRYLISTKSYENELANHEQKLKFYNDKLERERRRKEYSYWSALNPYDFECEMAELFKRAGYRTKRTKGSGDGGIDIILKKDGKIGIVQCKRYAYKVGPSPVRDLYGAMQHGKFNFGKIVCPSGFTSGAFEFSKGKNIELLGLKRIIELANN